MPGSVIFLFVRAIVLSISAILTFRVSSSSNADTLAYIYLLSMALNYSVSTDVYCFTFYAPVWPVVVEAPRDTSSGGCI